MDDPDLSWPAWKFGMKQGDLFTTLHDRYNTFTYTLQDPEAFHHDVYEASRDADTSEHFHQLLADRQRQRLQELHQSLETLAVEIIANPKLMVSDQWQYAVQLFRTKSFDSLVRFFASYLPEDYLDHHDTYSTSSSFSEVTTDGAHTPSTEACSANDAPCSSFRSGKFFDGSVMTDEPCTTQHDDCDDAHHFDAPLSPPESEADSEPSVLDADSPGGYSSTGSLSRSMSFSDSESGDLGPQMIRRSLGLDDDETSQSDDCDTAVTSVCDSSECHSAFDPAEAEPHFHVVDSDEDEELSTTQYPDDDEVDMGSKYDTLNDTLDSATATPRANDFSATCYTDFNKSMTSRQMPSPQRRSPSPKSHLAHRREVTPVQEVRRSPEESQSKIQKPMPEALKKRPRIRMRMA